MKQKTFILLISLVLAPITPSAADSYIKGISFTCRVLELSDLTQGKFKVLDLTPAKRICYSAKDSQISSQIGPGCFVHLRRISKRDLDISSDSDLILYSENSDCSLKAGQTISKQMSSYCCSVKKPIDCGSEQPEKNFCFGQKIFHDMPEFAGTRESLGLKQKAFLERQSKESKKIEQKNTSTNR